MEGTHNRNNFGLCSRNISTLELNTHNVVYAKITTNTTNEYNCIIITSLPEPASMSRNESISVRTSFAAFALLTCCRNVARVNSINRTSSVKQTHSVSMHSSLLFYVSARASTSIPTLSQIVCQIERSFIALEMSLVDDRPASREIDLI